MGHPASDVWSYTPKQISGFLWFASKRLKVKAAEALSIQFNASRGDPKEVKRMIGEWSR